MCKSAPMDTDELARKIRHQLEEIDRSAASVSVGAVGKDDAIKRIYQGHKPSFDRACKLIEALGLEHYIGPPRRAAKTVVRALNSSFSGARRSDPAPTAVRDRRLAELLAAIEEHWESRD